MALVNVKFLLSVVVPVFNEQEVLPETCRRLPAVLDQLGSEYELIFVDDGSRDDSFAVLLELAKCDPRIKVIRLSRNFGQQVAVSAGLDCAAGDAVIVMDADLQDEPEAIPEFVRQWQQGYDVVYNVRDRRLRQPFVRRLGTNLFYDLLRRFAGIEIPEQVGLFRLVDRRVVEAVRAMHETNRFLPGMFAWAGFKQIGLHRDRPDRAAGRPKPLTKLAALALDALISFSNFPLRVALWLGAIVSSASFLLGAYLVVRKIIEPARPLDGWRSLVVTSLFLGGVQLVALGIIGEYVGRLYDEAKRRPLYLVRERVNFEGK
jgi:dolichol-phosphate mannosyltransferase